MRKIHTAIAVAALLTSAGAHADTIADWTFETTAPTTAGPLAAEVGTGLALGHHSNGAAVYSSPAGNGSTHSFSSNTWSVGDYYQFSVSTAGLQDISFSWDQIGSSTGPRDFAFQYSTDGSHFTDFDTYEVLSAPAWSSNPANHTALTTNVENLATITSLNNQAMVLFRLVDNSGTAINGGTVGTAGTGRVDNVVITGVSAVPLPAAVWLFGSGIAALAGLRRRRPQ
jgi:hypothetical protein